ncbi:25184_t:CDS:2, partial [Cetraspora pellucida]
DNSSIVQSDSISSQETSSSDVHINNKKRSSAKRSSETTHLHWHLSTCNKYKIATGLPTSANTQHDPDNNMQYTFNQIKNWVYSEEKSRNNLVNMVIRDELSFQLVEHTGFLNFISEL